MVNNEMDFLNSNQLKHYRIAFKNTFFPVHCLCLSLSLQWTYIVDEDCSELISSSPLYAVFLQQISPYWQLERFFGYTSSVTTINPP